MVGSLTSLGATVVELPVISIADAADGGRALDEAATRLVGGAYDWVALTSANAASRLLAVVGARPLPSKLAWAVLGEGTAAVLREAGREPDLVSEVASAEGLATAFPALDASGNGHEDGDGTGDGNGDGEGSRDAVTTRRTDDPSAGRRRAVLFPRAERVRGSLGEVLRHKGWVVDEVVAYRTVAGDPGSVAVAAAAGADAIAFTSPSTVEYALAAMDRHRMPPVAVTIGPSTSAAARDAGIEVTAEASPHTVDGLVDAFGAGPRRRPPGMRAEGPGG